MLAFDHTSLRTPSADSNRSRWPLHPVWADIQARVGALEGLGVVKEIDPAALLDERLVRMVVSVYGYMKRIAAINGLRSQRLEVGLDETLEVLRRRLWAVHDPLSWESDVDRRMTEMRLGQW